MDEWIYYCISTSYFSFQHFYSIWFFTLNNLKKLWFLLSFFCQIHKLSRITSSHQDEEKKEYFETDSWRHRWQVSSGEWHEYWMLNCSVIRSRRVEIYFFSFLSLDVIQFLMHSLVSLSVEGAALTLKVDLLHNVLGFDALLLVEDEDLSFLVLCPAVLIHPDLHLCVWTNRAWVHIVSLYHC